MTWKKKATTTKGVTKHGRAGAHGRSRLMAGAKTDVWKHKAQAKKQG